MIERRVDGKALQTVICGVFRIYAETDGRSVVLSHVLLILHASADRMLFRFFFPH